MIKYFMFVLFAVLSTHFAADASAADTTPGAFDQKHTLFANILGEYVNDGAVNYAGIKSDPENLKNYLSTIHREPADRMAERILDKVEESVKGVPQTDDIALVLVKRN